MANGFGYSERLLSIMGDDTRRRLRSLEDVLRSRSLGGVVVGSAVDEIEAHLGEPELPPARLSRRSRVRVWVYGNTSLFVEEGKVVLIQIDLHGRRHPFVAAATMGDWRMREWREYAAANQLAASETLDVHHFADARCSVSVDQDGRVGLVELR